MQILEHVSCNDVDLSKDSCHETFDNQHIDFQFQVKIFPFSVYYVLCSVSGGGVSIKYVGNKNNANKSFLITYIITHMCCYI